MILSSGTLRPACRPRDLSTAATASSPLASPRCGAADRRRRLGFLHPWVILVRFCNLSWVGAEYLLRVFVHKPDRLDDLSGLVVY